ncbi:hypothetical protein BS50DRAFT_628920 [Corynespora cassiicola Philippines]|uniref:Uncharacterized protein n=1 Tax=Corynespora cassiicola Philippines TaxID=1448308 RepID=A0A2T2P590_CORCC|nr:hypothetical protein BS50DRAFT_628920 [Corynespora cassiicola Philippines]
MASEDPISHIPFSLPPPTHTLPPSPLSPTPTLTAPLNPAAPPPRTSFPIGIPIGVTLGVLALALGLLAWLGWKGKLKGRWARLSPYRNPYAGAVEREEEGRRVAVVEAGRRERGVTLVGRGEVRVGDKA